ncbi:hypothetical protein N656DRAFT_205887 [Canariomyces notabilis]|uniref:Uncharacterized protein n=1 Tax=Canariomyces notabilis TaxID=2074819 RepID=A0AAN6QHP7_9PEZI|nr:hypothetical protein N656DRAFT_205887 [Canariomyces arenarius]
MYVHTKIVLRCGGLCISGGERQPVQVIGHCIRTVPCIEHWVSFTSNKREYSTYQTPPTTHHQSEALIASTSLSTHNGSVRCSSPPTWSTFPSALCCLP